jgi:branched-chain amino acid transport system substrate-binding protein
MKRWLLLLLALLLAACSNWDYPAVARAKRAATAKGDIVIGAVWPWKGPKGRLWDGMELAVAEINAAGGVLNRKLSIVKEDDESSLAVGRQVAQKFVDNPDMVAVIGHFNSYVAIPASSIYQSAGLLYLTPNASAYEINDRGYDLVFRSYPSNRSLAPFLAEFMARQSYQRVAILYSKDRVGQAFANYFERRAREVGLNIVDRRPLRQGTEDFTGLLRDWKDLYQVDAVFMAAVMPEAATLLKQARAVGLNVPFVHHGALADSQKFLDAAGVAAEGVLVPAFFIPDMKRPLYARLDEMHRAKWGRPANESAADRKSTRLNSSHNPASRMPSSA